MKRKNLSGSGGNYGIIKEEKPQITPISQI